MSRKPMSSLNLKTFTSRGAKNPQQENKDHQKGGYLHPPSRTLHHVKTLHQVNNTLTIRDVSDLSNWSPAPANCELDSSCRERIDNRSGRIIVHYEGDLRVQPTLTFWRDNQKILGSSVWSGFHGLSSPQIWRSCEPHRLRVTWEACNHHQSARVQQSSVWSWDWR